MLLQIFIFSLFYKDTWSLVDTEYDSRLNIELEHSFDEVSSGSTQFIHRGEIAVKSLHSGSVYQEQSHLNPTQIRKLNQLVQNRGYYRLKATVRSQDGKQNSFATFMPACGLVESHLSDVISVHLDRSGNVVGVSVSSPVDCKGKTVKENQLKVFNTTVIIRHMELGPIPDTASYIQKIEREKEARERGDTKDNRSFIAKYWMYIVPVVIFVALTGGANPDGGGQR